MEDNEKKYKVVYYWPANALGFLNGKTMTEKAFKFYLHNSKHVGYLSFQYPDGTIEFVPFDQVRAVLTPVEE